MKPHITEKIRDTKAQMQAILATASDQVLKRMSMDTTLELIKTCLIPSLLYGAEAWILNKSELSTLERTVTQILRLTLQVPTSTPSVALYMDLGIMPIEGTIDTRRLNYYRKITAKRYTFLAKRVIDTQANYYSYAKNWQNEIMSLYMCSIYYPRNW